MARGGFGRFGARLEITGKAARAQLSLLLGGCTDAALARFTPEGLAATHRVPVKTCEYALTVERRRRAADGLAR